jgi:hypothetical protein
VQRARLRILVLLVTADRDNRVWEWAQRVSDVLEDAGVTEHDSSLSVATAEFLADQADLLDYPQPVLTDRDLLLVSRAVALTGDRR